MISAILERQSGVISREQAYDGGMDDGDLRRLVRRRRWARVHPGVYVDHTGPLTWLQRAWAAVLFCGPAAALCHASARRAADGPGRVGADEGVIHVAIDHRRTVRAPAGVRVHRVVALDATVSWRTSPPRQRLEHVVIARAAAAPRDIDAVAEIGRAVGARLTTAARLVEALDTTPRVARRRFLSAVLADVGAGTCTALERGYLSRVERAHGLPGTGRTLQDSSGGAVRTLRYAEGLVVLLDGRFPVRAGEELPDTDVVRLGWHQVHEKGCATAARIAAMLRARGWEGQVRSCPRCLPPLARAA
ncbi:type IV toxin-antitoxin system AbiEi family antitoxin domain-containing protein [Nocardioides maradonensis]